MGDDRTERLSPGRQLYDPLNGIRVGGLAGALLGALGTWLGGSGWAWLIVALAAVGATVGYLSERRNLRRTR